MFLFLDYLLNLVSKIFLKGLGVLVLRLFKLIVNVCLFLSVFLVKVKKLGMVFLCYYIDILFESFILKILSLELLSLFVFVGIVVSICFSCCFFNNLFLSK